MEKSLITPGKLHEIFARKNYSFFVNDRKDYNVNIVGVRSADMTPDVFNDYISVCWKYLGRWYNHVYECTTDPGLYYLNNPMNCKGTAILVPAQYKGAYMIGIHKTYEALRQKKPMKYWRDNNRDNRYDMSGKIYEEIGYTDIHRANDKKKSYVVGKFSAGCQVISDSRDFSEFMSICRKSAAIYGNSFTYTLLTEDDFK